MSPRVLNRAAIALVAIASLLLPLILNASQLDVYVLLGSSAMVTLGISLLMGFSGQVSLGQGGFYAIGAYTAGVTSTHGWPTLLGLLCAPIFAGLVAFVIAIPIMRLRGHYLAFATIAIQLVVLSVVTNTDALGGGIGIEGIPQLNIVHELSSPKAYAWLTWVAVAVLLLIAHNIVYSRAGRGLRALATSEVAAASSGVPVTRYRISVFAISAAFAGLAGGIYAYFLGFISPGSFPITTSFGYVIMAVIGGLGSVWGAVVGATLITLLVQLLNHLGTLPGLPADAPSVFTYAAYGLVLVLSLLFMQRGIVPTVGDFVRRLVRPAAAVAVAQEAE
jgi:branched-chain amino acid transport system permease protein